MAALSWAVGGIADADETTLHLFIFNFLVDVTAIFAVASLLTGFERFKHDRSAGLRTFSATVAFRVRRN